MTRVIVTGGRHFDNAFVVFRVLSSLHENLPITALAEGGAGGADFLGGQWADQNRVDHQVFPALWKVDGYRAAGPIRNQRMLDEFKPQLVVAFPGGRGTADMVRRAERAGVEIVRITTPEYPRG